MEMRKLIQQVFLATSPNKLYFWSLLLSLVICAQSCKTVSETDNESYVEVIGSDIEVTGDIADASVLYADNDNLYFIHNSSSPMLSKYSIVANHISNENNFISIGNGPYEMQSLIINSISSDKTYFIFSDPNIKKAIRYNLLTDSVTIHKIMRDNEDAKIFRLAVGHPRGSLATYTSTRNKNTIGIVGLISSTDSTFTPLKGVGNEKMENLPISGQFHYAPNCRVFVQPGGTKCLFLSCTGLYAEIFEIEGNCAKNKIILVNNVPSFSIDERGRIATASDDLKYGFKACVTSDRIYLAPRRLSYSETKSNGLKNSPTFAGVAQGPDFIDEIWEFDWNGKSTNKYRLYPGVSSFQVTSSHVLWATSEDNNYDTTIMRYNLSE